MTRRRPPAAIPSPESGPPLPELAADAVSAVSDLFDEDDALDAFCAKSDLEKIRWRYLHADCDDFALALAILQEDAWPVVAAQSAEGPLHRLNRTANGRLVDASGYVTEDELCRRYGQKRIELVPPGLHGSLIDNDADLRRVFAAMAHLPTPPFNEPDFRRRVALWMLLGHHFDDPPPRPRVVPGAP